MERQILFVFKVGHSVQRKAKPSLGRTHHWRCYVDSWSPRYPLSNFVKKVTFKLHDTFDNPKQVVRQAPFAIEEDGFGNFRLQIEVTFFDCVTNFTYDLTLFDHSALHAYRTVQIDPSRDNWDAMIQLGGIAIPRNNSPHDVQKVVQTIQASSAVEKLNPYSFFPFLEHQMEKDLSSPQTNSSESGTQASMELDGLHEEHGGWADERTVGVPVDGQRQHQHADQLLLPPPPPPPPLPPPQRQPTYSSRDNDFHDDAMRSVDRYLNQRPLLQKHKKKLQLLHEAQLRLENAQRQQSQWAASNQPHRSPSANSPHFSLVPLSPTISTGPYRPSPLRQTPVHGPDLAGASGQTVSGAPFRGTLTQDPSLSCSVSRLHDSITRSSPIRSPASKSISTGTTTTAGDSDSNSGKRIVLKLSRLGAGKQLTVSTSHLDESEAERRERRRRKKERREQQSRQQQQQQQQQEQLVQSQKQYSRAETLTVPTAERMSLNADPPMDYHTRTRFDAVSSPVDLRHHHHHHQQQQHVGDPDEGADSDALLMSPRKYSKLKRHKRSRPSRDHTDSQVSETASQEIASRTQTENRSGSARPQSETKRSARDIQIRNIFDTDPLDHYEEGDQSHTNDVVDDRHLDEGTVQETLAADGGLGSINRYVNHSHLLLDQDDHEFDDILSRSLISQYHDSTNPDSPFVDMFGDEDQIHSDTSMRSSDEGPGSNLATCARPTNPSALFESDGDEEAETTEPVQLSEPKPNLDINRGSRINSKATEHKTESRGSVQTDSESLTKKSTGSTSKSSSTSTKDHTKDEVEPRSRTVGSVHVKKLHSTTASGFATKRPASDSLPSMSENSRKDSRELSPLSCDSSDAVTAPSEKRAKLISRHSYTGKKTIAKDGGNTASKSAKRSDSGTSSSASKSSKPVKRDRDSGVSVTNSYPQSTGSDATGLHSPKPKSLVPELSKSKAERNLSKSKSDLSKESRSTWASAEKRPVKAKVRTTETKTQSPMNPKPVKLPTMFSEQDVELSSLSSSSSRASSPSPVASSSVSSPPTPPMSSVSAPTTTTNTTAPTFTTSVTEPNYGSTNNSVGIAPPVTVSDANTAKRVAAAKFPKSGMKTDKTERKKTAKIEPTLAGPPSDSKPVSKPASSEPAPKKQSTPSTDSTGLKKNSVKSNHERVPQTTNSTTITTTKTTTTTTVPVPVASSGSGATESTNAADSTGSAEPIPLTDQELELLFDRLLRLQQPHLAIRMGEILLAHQKSTPHSNASVKSTPDNKSNEKPPSTRSAVKVLHEKPRVIAFNLRRLPLDCLMQLTQLIAEDEATALKTKQKERKSTRAAASTSSSSHRATVNTGDTRSRFSEDNGCASEEDSRSSR